MLVGTFSGVTSAGIVISSDRAGTCSGNSSLTSERTSDVFPTPAINIKSSHKHKEMIYILVIVHIIIKSKAEDDFASYSGPMLFEMISAMVTVEDAAKKSIQLNKTGLVSK